MITGENFGYWFFALTLAAGFWLVYGVIATEFRRWRERRKAASTIEMPQSEPSRRAATNIEASEPAVRGFDSPELFRQDCLIRFRHLEKEIARQIE